MGKMPSRGGSYVRKPDGSLDQVEPPTAPKGDIRSAVEENADAVIRALKQRLSAETDLDLAEALSVGRSTIANWRRRERVPSRYARLVDVDAQTRLNAAFNYEMLSSEERAALCLAVMRMHMGGFLTQLESYPEFLRRGGFIPSQIAKNMEAGLRDLLSEMESKGYDDPQQCLNAMVFAEFFQE